MKRVLISLGTVLFGSLFAASAAQAAPLQALQEEDHSVGLSVIVPLEDDQETAVQLGADITFARINESLVLQASPFYNTEQEIGGTVDISYAATPALSMKAGIGGVTSLDDGPGALTNADNDSSFLIKAGANYAFSESTGVYGGVLIPTDTDTVSGSLGLTLSF